MSASPTMYLALLRGVNVGGNAMVNMRMLKSRLEALGFQSVRTYINSGNVIFITDATDHRKLESDIEAELSATFSLSIRVIIRDYKEMEQLIRAIPPSWGMTNRRYNIIFLHHTIDDPEIVQSFHPKAGIEELYYHSGTILWAADVETLTHSAMVKLSKSVLYHSMTIRNLNTTRKLYTLMHDAQVLNAESNSS